jgi:lysophospholipase L1-like esterase
MQNGAMAEAHHPWSRYVALGDSFTEGIGDPEPRSPGGHRGWADRVAEVLSQQTDDFAYANLAVRGKLIKQILNEQVEPAVALRPDLITISAGGNDVIRPGTDPDVIAQLFDDAVSRLSVDGATIVVFTGVDVGFSPVFRGIRGKVAIYNENVRAVAARHDCIVADQWALTDIQNDLQPMEPEPLPPRTWRQARSEDLSWAREYLVPWVVRRIRHQSSGDHVTAKRPDAGPFLLGGD